MANTLTPFDQHPALGQVVDDFVAQRVPKQHHLGQLVGAIDHERLGHFQPRRPPDPVKGVQIGKGQVRKVAVPGRMDGYLAMKRHGSGFARRGNFLGKDKQGRGGRARNLAWHLKSEKAAFVWL